AQDSHSLLYPLAAHLAFLSAQGVIHTGTSVALTTCRKHLPDVSIELQRFDRPRAQRGIRARVNGASVYPKRPADRGNRGVHLGGKSANVCGHDVASLTKKTVAFFRISRSCRRCRTS